MPIKLKCRCGERLTAPDSAVGKKGKCSKCGMTFVIPAPAPTSSATAPSAGAKASTPKPKPQPTASTPDDDFGLSDLGGGLPDLGSDLDDFLAEETPNPFQSPVTVATPEPKPASTSGKIRAQRSTLANGIKLVFWGTAFSIISTTTMLVGALIHPIVVIVALGVMLISGLTITVGRIVCLGGPKETPGRVLLLLAVLCDVSGVVLAILMAAGVVSSVGMLISSLLGMCTFILFLIFIKMLARSIEQQHLAEDASAIMVFLACIVVMIIGIPFVAMLSALLVIPIAVGLLGFAIVGFSKYLNLLQFTAEAVRRC